MQPQLTGQCSIALDASGNHLACLGHKWLDLYNARTGELKHELRLRSGNGVKSAFHPQQPIIFIVTDNATVEVIDMVSGSTSAVIACRGRHEQAENVALIRGENVDFVGDANVLFAAP